MGLFGEMFDLGAEIVKIPTKATIKVVKEVSEVADDMVSPVVKDLTEVAKDIGKVFD